MKGSADTQVAAAARPLASGVDSGKKRGFHQNANFAWRGCLRGKHHHFSSGSVLFVEALTFLMLARRGVYIPLSAAVACAFAVFVHTARIVWREEKHHGKFWMQVFAMQHWSTENRRSMQSACVAATAFAVTMAGLAWLFDRL